MKLSTVLGSTNLNSQYYMFIPKQILFWKHFGIKFIAVVVGDKIPDELKDFSDNIIESIYHLIIQICKKYFKRIRIMYGYF